MRRQDMGLYWNRELDHSRYAIISMIETLVTCALSYLQPVESRYIGILSRKSQDQ